MYYLDSMKVIGKWLDPALDLFAVGLSISARVYRISNPVFLMTRWYLLIVGEHKRLTAVRE